MSARPPTKKLRLDRVIIVLVVLGGAAFAGYWFGIR
jgi:hypothetical protein